MFFEWDPKKDKLNIKKHGISFSEATKIFEDPLQLSILDHRFSYFEERWITLGLHENKVILVVAHIYFDLSGEEIVRIISAREATAHERNQYERF
jgi:uncharacterized DUF497 family protein